MPCSGPSHRALHHVRRDAVVGVVLRGRRGRRARTRPRPTAGTTSGDRATSTATGRADPVPRQAVRRRARGHRGPRRPGTPPAATTEEAEAGAGVHRGAARSDQQREAGREQRRRRRRRSSRPGPGSGCGPGPAPAAASTSSRMPSHHGAPASPSRPVTSSRKPTVGHRQPAGVEQQAGAGTVDQRREPPGREQHGHHRRARRPAGPRPSGRASRAALIAEPGSDHDQREHDAEPEQQRRERRAQREQQRAAPGRPPAAVGLGVGEAERGVGQPRQQGGHGDDAEAGPRPTRR